MDVPVVENLLWAPADAEPGTYEVEQEGLNPNKSLSSSPLRVRYLVPKVGFQPIVPGGTIPKELHICVARHLSA